jgi:hypothetical protein
MRISLARELEATPAAVWLHLAEPDRINRWSRARVVGISPGDRGHPGGVGALRRVEVPLLFGLPLREVVSAADPPSRLCYQVLPAFPVRYHRGAISIEARGSRGAALRWEVEAELFPGAGALALRALRPLLEDSLDRLVALLRGAGAAAEALPRFEPLGFEPDPAVAKTADAVLVEQQALASELARAGDAKRWFARVYELVTSAQVEHVRRGSFAHPEWVLRLIPVFHRYYVDNLARWRGSDSRRCEEHWRRAFSAAERAGPDRRGAQQQLFAGLLFGVRAHIEGDLPRALAEVYADHYASRCDFVRFRADYLTMGELFRSAAEALTAEMPPELVPLWSRLGRRLPAELSDLLRRRRFYDLDRARERAFFAGGQIADLLLRRST